MVSQSQSPAHIYTSDTAPDFKALVKAKKKKKKINKNQQLNFLSINKKKTKQKNWIPAEDVIGAKIATALCIIYNITYL